MIPIQDQIKCAKRELKLRKQVYRGWVASGRMKEKDATHEIEAMAAIVGTLEDLAYGQESN